MSAFLSPPAASLYSLPAGRHFATKINYFIAFVKPHK
nr:MAG TPA: hypothetical protein [Caudoviricetes sp.]